MGRVGYGPSLSWAEFVMGRDVQLPFIIHECMPYLMNYMGYEYNIINILSFFYLRAEY